MDDREGTLTDDDSGRQLIRCGGPRSSPWTRHLDALASALGGAPQPWLPGDPTPGWLAVGRRYGVSAVPRP
jgi:hypothetical protein